MPPILYVHPSSRVYMCVRWNTLSIFVTVCDCLRRRCLNVQLVLFILSSLILVARFTRRCNRIWLVGSLVRNYQTSNGSGFRVAWNCNYSVLCAFVCLSTFRFQHHTIDKLFLCPIQFYCMAFNYSVSLSSVRMRKYLNYLRIANRELWNNSGGTSNPIGFIRGTRNLLESDIPEISFKCVAAPLLLRRCCRADDEQYVKGVLRSKQQVDECSKISMTQASHLVDKRLPPAIPTQSNIKSE